MQRDLPRSESMNLPSLQEPSSGNSNEGTLGDLVSPTGHSSHHDRKKKPAKQRTTFPWKLHRMLQDAKKENREHILSWSADGKAFKIHNKGLFVSEILPKYFNRIQYRSFQRMLNLYDFRNILSGTMRGGYDNPYFIGDKEDLCKKMAIHPSPNSCHTTTSLDRILFTKKLSSPPESSSQAGFSHQEHDLSAIGKDHPFIRMMNERPDLRPSQQMEHQEAPHIPQEMNEQSSVRRFYPDGGMLLPPLPVPANDYQTQQREREVCTGTSRVHHRGFSTEAGESRTENDFELYLLGYDVDDLLLHDPLPHFLEPRPFHPRFCCRPSSCP